MQDFTISKTGPGSSLLNIEGGGVVTMKDGVYDVVGTNLSQTLTNKTISNPTISGTLTWSGHLPLSMAWVMMVLLKKP